MGTISEEMYASQQINVPLNLPYILKQYAKAAIKTQPRDLLHWSSAYFRALANGDVPPVKDRIEYPLISTPSGLTAGFLKILIKQFGKSGIIEEKELIKKWKGVGLEIDELHNMLRLCGFRKTVRWLNFVAVAAGFLSPNLTQTMILLCELLTDEPEGGSAAILYQTFMTLYIYLARMDCGPICHLKSSMADGFSDEVPSDDVVVGKADELSEEKSSEKLSDIEVALERKPTLDSNDSAQGVMVWEDVAHPDMVVQESTPAEEDVVTEADIADNIPVDVVDEPTTVDNEEEDKADDKESVKSTESYDNTGITLTFHDPEQDVRIDDYTGPIEPKLKKRYEKRLEEGQNREETDNKAETDETRENEGQDDGIDHKEEGEEQEEENEQNGEEKTNGGEEVVEVDKEGEGDGDKIDDGKVESEVEHKEEEDKTGEEVGKLDEVGGNDGDKNDVVEENGEGVKSEKDGGGEEDVKEEDVVEKESGMKVEEVNPEEQPVEESDKLEGKTSAEIKDSDKRGESGGEKTQTTRKKRKKEREEGEAKEEGEEEESDHEEQSRYEYSLELEEEEEHEKVEEEEKEVKEENMVVESGEVVKEEAKVEEEAGKEEEEEEEEIKEEQSADLDSTDSAVPLQGQRKSDIEVYGCLHLPKHRNLSFTDSIVSEPDNHFWVHVPGIGPLVPEKQILGLKAYFLYWSEKQNGYVMPRNIKHHLCPTMEPPVIEREKERSISDADWVHDVGLPHGDSKISITKDNK